MKKQSAEQQGAEGSEFEGYKGLLQAWPFNKPVTAKQILARCRNDSAIWTVVFNFAGGGLLDADLLEVRLRRVRDRVCDGRTLRMADAHGGYVRWEVVATPSAVQESDAFKELLRVWPFNESVTARQIVDRCKRDPALSAAVLKFVGTSSDTLDANLLGRDLRRVRDRVCDGKVLRAAVRRGGLVCWAVLTVTGSQIEQKSFPNDKDRVANYVSVAERVTQDDAKEALWRVWCQLFSPFPFEDLKASQKQVVGPSRWELGLQSSAAYVPLAAILTVLLRDRIEGPVPGIIFDSSTCGTGKTSLMDVISRVVTGRPALVASLPVPQSELEQVLASYAVSKVPVVAFDDVSTTVGGAVLARALTADEMYMRLLGKHELRRFDWRTVLMFAGNNVRSAEDCFKRVLTCRLGYTFEQPCDVEFERYVGHSRKVATRYRDLILRDLYTIVRAWENAEQKPDAGACAVHESWAQTVPSMIMYAGGPNVLQALNRKVDRG
jgi:hypothetical protein